MASKGIYGTIEGVGRLAKRLQTVTRKMHSARVVVGYGDEKTVNASGTSYVAYVHEDLEMEHLKGGQAKFLSEPAELHAKDIRDYIAMRLKKGATLKQALGDAGRILLGISKKLVPVDTGRLKESGFTAFEET